MRRIVPALLLLSTILVSCTTAAPAPRVTPRQQLVTVFFESRPDRAELYIDGRLVGSTDLNYHLTPGVHTIEVRKEGFEMWRRELTVSPGVATKLSAMLTKS